MRKEMRKCLEGFFNIIAPRQMHEFYEHLKLLPAKELYTFMETTRRKEMEQLLHTDFWTYHKEMIKQNLSFVQEESLFIDDEIEKMMEYHFIDCYIWLLFFAIQNQNESFLTKHITLYNEHHVKEALEKGNGAILGQLHWGPFQLLAPVLVKYGYTIMQFLDNQVIKKTIEDIFSFYYTKEECDSLQIVTAPQNGLLFKAVKALKRNELVSIPLEVSHTNALPKQTVSFLKEEIYAPEGACAMSFLAKAPIILVRVESKKDHLHIYFDEPMYVNEKREIEEKNQYLFNKIENHVLEHPKQWRGWSFLEQMLVKR